jgi:hypothetical protein
MNISDMPGYCQLICHLLRLLLVAGCWLLVVPGHGQTCTITSAKTDVLCFGKNTGSIDISVGGGTGSYIFSWTGPNTFASTSQNLTGLGVGSYTVTVIGAAGSCTGTSTVIISQPPQPLTILTQPLDQTDCYGNTVELSVEATGTVGEITYQWQSRPPGGGFTDISGENSTSLTIYDIGVNGQNIDGTEYQVLITDYCRTISSEPALLSINAVTGLSGSVNLTICSGEGTTYSVSTHGSVVGYHWSFNDGTGWRPVSDGGAFSGTTSQLLSISDATTSETGSYRVSVTFNTLNQRPDFPTCVITTHTRNRNLTVIPAISPPVISADQTICYNGVPVPLNASQASGGSGPGYSYQWQGSIDGVSWTDIDGAQALNFSPPVLTASTLYRIAATDEGPLRCGTVFSYPVTIIVNPLPVTSAIYHQ